MGEIDNLTVAGAALVELCGNPETQSYGPATTKKRE
jgi:hypothetical protein